MTRTTKQSKLRLTLRSWFCRGFIACFLVLKSKLIAAAAAAAAVKLNLWIQKVSRNLSHAVPEPDFDQIYVLSCVLIGVMFLFYFLPRFFCRSTRRWRLVPRKIWPSPAACMLRFLGSIGGVSVCPGAVDPSGEEAFLLRSTACAVLVVEASLCDLLCLVKLRIE